MLSERAHHFKRQSPAQEIVARKNFVPSAEVNLINLLVVRQICKRKRRAVTSHMKVSTLLSFQRQEGQSDP